MKSDKELEELIEPIIKIYNDIEIDLLRTIASHFDIYEEVGVSRSLEWWLKKLNDFGTLNKEAVEVISKYSNMTTPAIIEMLKEAGYANIDSDILNKAYLNNAIKIDPINIFNSPVMKSVIDNSFKELNETLKLINTKALESTKKAYMDVLNQSYLEVSSGIYDYNTSIRKALLEMTDKGITGATYKQTDGSIRNYSIEGVIRRDVMTAVMQTANKGSETLCNELGAEYVEVSSHLGARSGDGIHPHSDHQHWQGKVYKLHGFDEKYDNFYTQTGYGDILGLGGVNCRHKFWAFFPDISEPSQINYNEEENRKVYELTKKQRYLERQVRLEKKRIALAEETNDDELLKKSNKSLISKQKRLNDFCIENDLVRDKNREFVERQKSISLNEDLDGYIKNIDKLSKDKEHLIYVDIESGKQIGPTFTGSTNHVTGSLKTELLMKLRKEQSIMAIHNHPNNSSLSFDDIMAFNNNREIGSIVATSDKYVYLIAPGKNGKIKFNKKMLSAEEKYYRNLEENVKQQYKNLNYIERKHIVNTIYCKKKGWKYERIKKEAFYGNNIR